MAPKNLQEVIDAAAKPRRAPAQLADRLVHLPGRPRGLPELDQGAEGLARHRRALRPVAPHGQPVPQGLRRDQADLRHRDQLDRAVPGRQGQAVRADHRRRARHRRRHPVPRGGGRVRLRRPRARVELAAVPRRDRRLLRTSTSRSTVARPRARTATRSRRQLLPLPDPGPERVAGHREAQRRPARAAEVLQHVDHDHRRHHRPDAPPRHGRRTGTGDLGSVRRPRPHLDRDRERRRRVRAGPGRLARLPVEHARVRLDPLPAAGDLHRRGGARLPRVAARRRLRGDRHARRVVRLREHRGLLPHALGARLRQLREVRPRLHRP